MMYEHKAATLSTIPATTARTFTVSRLDEASGMYVIVKETSRRAVAERCASHLMNDGHNVLFAGPGVKPHLAKRIAYGL